MKSFFQRRFAYTILLLVGTLGGMLAWKLYSSHQPKRVALDPARVQVWEKIAPRLRQAEQRGDEFGERHLQSVKDFFADKRGHANDFADDVLGWGGKWAFLKGKFTADDGKAHQAHLKAAFARHIFTDRDIQERLQEVIASYLGELEGQENALLVEIQADLSEQDLPALRVLAMQEAGESFRGEYQKMVQQIAPVVGRDLKIAVGREAVVWVGSDIAAAVTIRVASAVALRLGVSGGILGTGAASGMATLGVGLVVGFVVDGAVDWIMRRSGYDPSGQIAGELCGTLSRIEGLMIEGDPEAKGIYDKLRRLQEHDRFSIVREKCRHSADLIGTSGAMGLRHELLRLRQFRGRLREDALRKLILEGVES
jgi:hypothetical protein